MFCMKCGTQLPEHAAFCNSCGTPTAQSAAAPTNAIAPQPPPSHQPQQQPATYIPAQPQPYPAQAAAPAPKSRRMLIVIAAILVVAVAGAAVFLLRDSGESQFAMRGGENQLELHTTAVNQTIRSLARAMNDWDLDAMADLWVPSEARKIRASDNVISSLPLESGDLFMAGVQAGLAFTETEVTITPTGSPRFDAGYATATVNAQVGVNIPLLGDYAVELELQLSREDDEWLLRSWELVQ